MSYAMSMSKSKRTSWSKVKGALLATAAASVLAPLAAQAQSMSVGITTNPLGGVASPNKYSGFSNVYIDPYDTDTLYVYASVTGTQAPSASYVDGLQYLYYNVNASTVGTTGLGIITAATGSSNFGGGSFTANGANTSPGAGAQVGALSTTAYTSTPSIAVGSSTTIASIAKPRSPGAFYWASSTGSGSNVVVNGDVVSFLVETLTYTPSTSAILSNPSAPGAPNSVSFNVSIPSVASFGPYTGSNYFVGLSSQPGLGVSPGASNTSTGYTAAATGVTLTNALPGDVNLDGTVNGSDLAVVASGFNKTTTGGWTAGDLNEDGVVNGSDLAFIASDFNKSLGAGPSIAGPLAQVGNPGGGGATAVPEPASLGLIAVAGLGLLRRRSSVSR